MLASDPIFTEKNNCRDCYKCVRWCPVKSIKVEKDSASIIPENCIHCGGCTLVCPAGAKKVRNDLSKVKGLLQSDSKIVVSIAPSFVADFQGVHHKQMIAALKMLGFDEVSETAIGAEMVSNACKDILNNGDEPFYISSACPSVVQLIDIYYPHLSNNITKVMSPLMAHASFLKQNLNQNAKVVFIGPCIAKKSEADKYPDIIDASLTFNDLKEWFESEQINPSEIETNSNEKYYPVKASSANKYPVDGGMINNIKADTSFIDVSFMSFSGVGNIKKVLADIDKWETENSVFLELLACDGGCINGPGTSTTKSLAEKRYAVIKQPNGNFDAISKQVIIPKLNLDIKLGKAIETQKYSNQEITDALAAIGKTNKNDELNCGGCGYNTCYDFVEACLRENAEHNMCVSYMRRIAQDKASALLQKMPSGVIMVNHKMEVIEVNKSFAQMLGSEIESLFELNPGLTGAQVEKLVPFHKLFSSVLQNGEEYLEKDIRENGKLFHVSIFTIQKHRIVCGLFRNMFAPEVRNEEVINRTQMVIQENLSTVQKIAFLLGENASKTESILNSIVESHHNELGENDN